MYRLKFNRFGHKAGTIVYDLVGSDYGNASMDSFATQISHISVTRESDRTGPFFTVPERDLEKIIE